MKESDATPVQEIAAILGRINAQCNTERELQDRVNNALCGCAVIFLREYKLKNGGRLDFYIPGPGFNVAIETKTKDSQAKVLRQIKQYADAPEVNHVIVMSRQPLALPATLSGKPIHNVEIWKNFA